MNWQFELSHLLITHTGKLVLLDRLDFEILGVKEIKNGNLEFKIRK